MKNFRRMMGVATCGLLAGASLCALIAVAACSDDPDYDCAAWCDEMVRCSESYRDSPETAKRECTQDCEELISVADKGGCMSEFKEQLDCYFNETPEDCEDRKKDESCDAERAATVSCMDDYCSAHEDERGC
ncbi:MAG: hypothetical protein HY897_26160 [Deltaproteobacteria bacterium]|nr:hypothetical protein [Deltaproteobacteria bacterium]